MASIKEIEEKVLKFWNENKIFEKSLEQTKNKKEYIFYDGPPFATGSPHHGHLLGSTVKDLFGRFWTMRGRHVARRWGWDCHGLPIENIAEKELKINSKDEIEKMGVKKFNSFCRSKVFAYEKIWGGVIERLGRWVDFDNSYKTMDNSYIESVWWAFKQLYDKGYIYEGEKILMYCPRCSTPLSKSEISMDNSYKMVKDSTMVVKFKLKDEDAYAIAWTTTPWTLPSNLALAVNPKLIYSYIKDKENGETYLLAKELISSFWKEGSEYEITKEVLGKDLEGIEYEPLFPYFKNTKNAFKILVADFVTAEDGTGIVHTAPNFGEEDYDICRKNKIPIIDSVDEKGNFTKAVIDFAGGYIHDSNIDIIKFLKNQGKVVLVRKMEHEYPFCYRCDTKLMYRAIPAWFVDIQKIKPRMLELNKKLNWYPGFLKEGRVKYNIETAPDWNISRNRYWATAMPIWKSEDGEILVIGSEEELKKYAKNLPKEKIDLHKDFLDEIILEKDGKEFKRIPEVLDCWFESGSMPFAQFHYPFENKEFFEKNFPAQFVAEYIGQIRAWFYYMLALSAILFDDIPFENVVTTGTILAEDGQKMSKSKKNFTDPMELIDKYGADAFRFYEMSSVVMNADNFNFLNSGVEEVYKKVLLLLYNVSNFYSTYKKDSDNEKNNSKNIMDKWILSRCEDVSNKVGKYLEDYNTIKACLEIKKFVNDLSTWYVRNSRDRFNLDNIDCRKTLRYVLDRISKLMAPIMPFVSEKIYQDINGEDKSVHLEKWPTKKGRVDEILDKDMELTREIVSLGLRERDRNQVGLKWPLNKVLIKINEKLSDEFLEIVREQLNVKNIEVLKTEKDIEVKLDLDLTPELESEGYARVLSRNVQSHRKKLGLNQKDKVKLNVFVNDEFKKILENKSDLIKERTNSLDVNFLNNKDKPKLKDKIEFKIKDKKGEFVVEVQ